MTYDWQAALVTLGTVIVLTVAGKRLLFRIPGFAAARTENRAADVKKLSRARFKAACKASNKAGLGTNAVFYVTLLPFCVSLDAQPLWRSLVDIAAVLMIYDFFYYLTHRFLFHGTLLRQVHALHHQARKPTHIDAFYVHPLETTIGVLLFVFSLPLYAALTGAPLNAFAAAIAIIAFTQLNTLNHTWTDLPGFPSKTVNAITSLHAAHHVDMNQGNYATITMFYDWLFGTLETPVHREKA